MVKTAPMRSTDDDMVFGRVGLSSAARQRGWGFVPRPPESLAEFRAEAGRYLEDGSKGAKDEFEKWGEIVKGRAPHGASRDTPYTRREEGKEKRTPLTM